VAEGKAKRTRIVRPAVNNKDATMGITWYNPAIGELMQIAGWSPAADDDVSGKTVPSTFFSKLVQAHIANPGDATARRNVGLIALLVGVAEWGVSGDNVPPDPQGTHWESNSGPKQGKHLMSYDLGGIGISHVDSAELGKFVQYVALEFIVDAEQRKRYLRFADASLYRVVPPAISHDIMYNQIRASGVCVPTRITKDLNGNDFAEDGHGGAEKYCSDWKNPNFSVEDWQLFRHYARVALRTSEGQEWVLDSWLDHNWTPSVEAVLASGGSIDEALANARVRSSFPVAAKHALQKRATSDTERIQREIDAYEQHKHTTAECRSGFILRSVALYRKYAGLPQLTGIKCPA
jgi:hypothetical protein